MLAKIIDFNSKPNKRNREVNDTIGNLSHDLAAFIYDPEIGIIKLPSSPYYKNGTFKTKMTYSINPLNGEFILKFLPLKNKEG